MPKRMTVAAMRAEGVRGAWVHCQNGRCRNYAYLTWEAMKLTPADTVEDLGWRRRIRCSVCGGGEVYIRPCWTQPFP